MPKPVQVRALTIFDVIAEHQQKVAAADAAAQIHTYEDAVKNCASLADGNHLVIYAPGRQDANEHLCVVERVTMALRRDGEVRLVVDGRGMGLAGAHYVYHGDYVSFEGFLSDKTIVPARRAKEGTEFRGWKKTKQYKLTRNEIHALIYGQVFPQD